MNYKPFCASCGHYFWWGEPSFRSVFKRGWLPSPQRICEKCWERENMSSIKITAEVDGKQIPLESISTETFEAIKALEKSKEIPVARLATFRGRSYLFLRQTRDIHLTAGLVHLFDFERGTFTDNWEQKHDAKLTAQYGNIRPL